MAPSQSLSMTPRALRATTGVLLMVVLLFAGRWMAGLFTERWWAEQISPQAARFVTDWAVYTLLLEVTGVVVACAWFIGHLLLVYRAIGSVQVHRRVGNLEIREAVNMRALAWLSIGGGLLLGLLAGRGLSDSAPTILLGWRGFQYGEAEPLLGQDLGFYLTTLPVWRLLHGYAVLLSVTALIGIATMYAVIGAVRWVDHRPAINDHARRHLGGLAVLLALVLAWGYLLEPYELIAGVIGTVHEGLFEYRQTVAFVLAGIAVAAAFLSLWWASRGRHAALLSIWALLAAASLLGHHIIPAFIGSSHESTLEPATRRHLDQLAYGMTGLRDTVFTRVDTLPDPPRPVALWHPTLAAEATESDSGRVAAADRAVVLVNRRPRGSWLVVRDHGARGASVSVVLDDQTTTSGQAVVYRDADSLKTQAGTPVLHLPLRGIWPRGPASVVDTTAGGVEIGSGVRRLVLAWALQSAALLGPGAPSEHVYWHLDPVERVQKLAPFAVWGVPSPRLLGGDLVWLVDGYLPSETFPGSTRVRWRGSWTGSLRAGFVGVVNARTGTTSIYLRHTADELAKQWRAISDSMVQPASAIPSEVVRALDYPGEVLEAQVRVLAQSHWGLGQVIGRGEPFGSSGPSEEALWASDTSGVELVAAYEQAPQRQVSAIVRARMMDGWESLGILRIDSLLALPEPAALQSRWGRFPTYQQLKDSVEKGGARLEPGPIRYWPTDAGLGAYQVHFARREGQEPTLAWVSIAVAERRGAGHDLEEAWQNMLGLSAPIVSAGERGSQLLEARRYIDAADAALKRGDLEAFGRAWDALKRTLKAP